jgi:hypothetical protein
MPRSFFAALALSLALFGCDMIGSLKEAVAQSEAAAAAIERQLGTKAEVGCTYENRSLTEVVVQFRTVPAASLAEIERVSRAVILATFKKEPENLVVSFAFQKGA